MERKVAVLHTTPVTVDPLKELATNVIPGCIVLNFVDDSILPQLIENGGNISDIEERLIQYAKNAEQVGADVILNACSSVGEVVAKARQELSVPIIRIDEAMAEEAVKQGHQIGVVATLSTTLTPTLKLLNDKAKAFNKRVEIKPKLAGEAYQYLIAGDKEAHDAALAKTLMEIARESDIVVLAQASMAGVVSTLSETQQKKFLSSPELGMERVRHVLEGVSG